MNKDVIYIEPEDDITDIILKIENSKEKIVALVPPKKAGVFRSVVNIKLIAKAGKTADKTVVLVTVDPSITKLAAATRLPVAKNLQTAPSIPAMEDDTEDSTSEKTDLVEDEDEVEGDEEDDSGAELSKKDSKSSNKSKHKNAEEADEDEEVDDEEEDDEEEEEKPKKKEKKKKSDKGGLKNWIKSHKKTSAFAGVVFLGLIALVVWMFFFAPAVDITVSIKTDQKNFSENVTFTDKLEEENAEEGKFYLEQKKIEDTQKVEFEATGQKNIGEKAHGNIVVYKYFPISSSSAVQIDAGTRFTVSGLIFTTDSAVTLSYGGRGEGCENERNLPELIESGCRVTARVNVTAMEPGSKYNIAMQQSGWDTVAPVGAYSDKAMEGGTDNVVTVVQQSDIISAQDKIKSSKEEENKAKLYETIDDKYYIIDSSFEQNTSNVKATPATDEEVKEGVKPSVEMTTTASVYVIDKVKLEQFIDKKAELAEDQKIYDIKDIYVENMSHIAVGATTKLKAQYFIGPKLTESELVDKIKGRGLGDARREIADIYGVSDVTINKSYPWVMAIPNNSNKITIKFEVKDQDGNDINTDENESEDGNDSGESEAEEESEEKKE